MIFSPFLGLQSFVQSSFIGQLIVVVLVLLSMVSWTTMLFKFRAFAATLAADESFLSQFRKESHPLSLFMKKQWVSGSPCARLYLRSCQQAARVLGMEEADIGRFLSGDAGGSPGHLTRDQLDIIREAAEIEMADQVLKLEQDMPWLAVINTVSPFLGLLGTVWGVMEAFNGMAVEGTPTLKTVGPGISAALLTTVAGLLVAIPSTVGYNFLTNKLRRLTVGMDNFLQELAGELHLAYSEER